MIPLPVSSEPALTVAQTALYCDRTETRWPALILPDTTCQRTHLLETQVVRENDYDLILSSVADPKAIDPKVLDPRADDPKKNKWLMQFTFIIKFTPKDPEWAALLELPAFAYVRLRSR
jgi:hypothetical protein